MIIAHVGSLNASQLTCARIADICSAWDKLKAGTRIGYHGGLRHWLEYLDAPIKCHAGIPHVASPEAPTRIVLDTEFEAALHAADPATALTLLLCRDAALRAATAYGLTSQNIVAGYIHAATKNEGAVIVPMSPRLAALVSAAVSRALPDEPLVYALGVSRGAREPDIGNVLRHRLAALQEREGLSDWTWHDLRRTAAQRLYERTGDLRAVQSLLGHKAMLTTLHYLNAQRAVLTPHHLLLMASGHPQPPRKAEAA